jgi:hypothetical protein
MSDLADSEPFSADCQGPSPVGLATMLETNVSMIDKIAIFGDA